MLATNAAKAAWAASLESSAGDIDGVARIAEAQQAAQVAWEASLSTSDVNGIAAATLREFALAEARTRSEGARRSIEMVQTEPEQRVAPEEAEAKSGGSASELLLRVKDAGVAGAVSYALWELGFWLASVPVCLSAYYGLTGHWPDLSNEDDVAKLGAEAFAFVNVARFAVPLRIGLALGTVPWVQANIIDRVPDAWRVRSTGT